MVKPIRIVGAGITGLTLARKLTDMGHSVIVYEREQEIGGLCRKINIGGVSVWQGPHIWYEREPWHREWITSLCGDDYISYHDYYVQVSADGNFDQSSLYDFPCSMDNLRRLGVCPPLGGSDSFKTLEQYFIASVGRSAYDLFFRGYNIKHWGIDPSKMSWRWVANRPLKLRTSDKRMFGAMPAGVPDDGYTRLFSALSKGIQIETGVNVDVDRLNRDRCGLVVSTATRSDIKYINVRKDYHACSSWPKNLTYSTTFPNTYNFTRMINYNLHDNPRGCGDGSLLSLACPRYAPSAWAELPPFVGEWVGSKSLDDAYPIPKKRSGKRHFTGDPIFCGRLGLGAYISMSNAVGKALRLASVIDIDGDMDFYYEQEAKDIW